MIEVPRRRFKRTPVARMEEKRSEKDNKIPEEQAESLASDSDETEDDEPDEVIKPLIFPDGYVYGVSSVTFLESQKHHQTILLIADSHYSENVSSGPNPCIDEKKNPAFLPIDFVTSILKLEDYFFDFFLEIPQEEPISEKRTNLLQLRNELKKCSYDNIRVHEADMGTPEGLQNMFRGIRMLEDLKIHSSMDDMKAFFKDEYSLYFEARKQPADQEDIYRIFGVTDSSLLFEEVKRIDEKRFAAEKRVLWSDFSQLKEALVYLYNRATPEYKQSLMKLLDTNATRETMIQEIDRYILIFRARVQKIMDLYVVARMFTRFRLLKEEDQTRVVPEYATNVVIYANEEHTKYIISMIERFDYEILYPDPDRNPQQNLSLSLPMCVKIPPPNLLRDSLIPMRAPEGYLYGVTSIAFMKSEKNHQTILLIGEIHANKKPSNCLFQNRSPAISPIDYVTSVLKLHDYFFDFFLEISPTRLKEEKWQQFPLEGNLVPFREKFKKCFDFSEKRCEYPNIRAHGADARIYFLQDLSFFHQQLFAGSKVHFKTYLGYFTDEMRKLPTETKTEEIYKLFAVSNTNLVFKELSRIDEENFSLEKKELWLDFQKLRMDHIRLYNTKTPIFKQTIKRILDKDPELTEPENRNDFREKTDEYLDAFLDLRTKIMDLYLVARIFHKFKLTKEDQKNNFPEYAVNSVIYAGGDHIENIVTVMKNFGYKTLYHDKKAEQRYYCGKAPSSDILRKSLIKKNNPKPETRYDPVSIDDDESAKEFISPSGFPEGYLSGVSSITFMESKKYRQTILLMGEYHLPVQCLLHKKKLVISPSDYVSALFKLNNYFFDFFLELSPTNLQEYKWDPLTSKSTNISCLRWKFKNCFDFIHKRCPYNNIRAHGADVRMTPDTGLYKMIFFIQQLEAKISCSEDELKKFIEDYYYVSLEIKKTPAAKNDIYEMFGSSDNSYLWKEIKRIDSHTFSAEKKRMVSSFYSLRTALVNLYNKKTPKFKKQMTKLLDSAPFLTTHRKRLSELVKEYQTNFYRVTSKIMDFYLVARIFHKFELTKEDQKKGFPSYPTNILIYAGRNHTRHIITLMEKFGYSILHQDEDDNYCNETPSADVLQKHLIKKKK